MPRQLTEGWLLGYREYTEKSEAPEPFHLWCAISALSAVLRRHVWIDQSFYTLFPNLFVVLVAPPGVCKKSVALNIALKLIRKVNGINIESNRMSPQALINAMKTNSVSAAPKTTAQKIQDAIATLSPPPPTGIVLTQECSATLASTEFSVMLGSDAHQSGLLALLTDLYDSPEYWSYKTISRGKEELFNVYINILAASTPDWLGSSIPADAIGGGFTSRILFVAQNQKRRDNPRPKITQRELDLRQMLIDDLNHIAELRGEIALSEKAEAFYDNWYRNERTNDVLDERFHGYLERKPDHLLKLASILSISFDDSLIVDDIHLQMGLQMLDRLEDRLPDAFKGVGSANTKDIERIFSQIQDRNGEISYKELSRLNLRYMNTQDLNIVITTLTDAGVIEDVVGGGKRILKAKVGSLHR